MKRIAFVVSSLVAMSTAAADTVEGPLFDSISLDRQSPVSKLDFDVAYLSYDEPDGFDTTFIAVTLGGQFVDPNSGLGAYGVLPLSYVSIDPPIFEDDSALMLGNAELGGIFTKWMSPRWALVLHGGVALPTAEDNDNLSGYQPADSSPRFTDLVQRIPNSTWFRFGISPMGRAGGLFWRADLGFDLALDEDNDNDNISPIMRLGFGGGFDLGTAQLLGEFSFLNVDDERNNDDDTAGTLALGARFDAGNVFPGIAIILPVEFDNRFAFEPDFALALTLSARLR